MPELASPLLALAMSSSACALHIIIILTSFITYSLVCYLLPFITIVAILVLLLPLRLACYHYFNIIYFVTYYIFLLLLLF
jgi:hypothetical protein